MDIRIDGKSVLITGGTGSLGMALVEVFSESGGDVQFQFYSNDNSALQLEKSFGAKPIKVDFFSNFNLPSCEFDILINNAGINISKRFSGDVPFEEWEKTIQLNTTVPYYLIKQCLPHMMKNNWGRIINISSIWGLRASTRNLPYNASKHALSGLTKTVAKEYASYGITCNEICPGPIESELMERIARDRERESGISREDYFRSICETIPAGRFARPKEIAQLALFLASDNAGYINAVSIPIDGALIA